MRSFSGSPCNFSPLCLVLVFLFWSLLPTVQMLLPVCVCVCVSEREREKERAREREGDPHPCRNCSFCQAFAWILSKFMYEKLELRETEEEQTTYPDNYSDSNFQLAWFLKKTSCDIHVRWFLWASDLIKWGKRGKRTATISMCPQIISTRHYKVTGYMEKLQIAHSVWLPMCGRQSQGF